MPLFNLYNEYYNNSGVNTNDLLEDFGLNETEENIDLIRKNILHLKMLQKLSEITQTYLFVKNNIRDASTKEELLAFSKKPQIQPQRIITNVLTEQQMLKEIKDLLNFFSKSSLVSFEAPIPDQPQATRYIQDYKCKTDVILQEHWYLRSSDRKKDRTFWLYGLAFIHYWPRVLKDWHLKNKFHAGTIPELFSSKSYGSLLNPFSVSPTL